MDAHLDDAIFTHAAVSIAQPSSLQPRPIPQQSPLRNFFSRHAIDLGDQALV